MIRYYIEFVGKTEKDHSFREITEQEYTETRYPNTRIYGSEEAYTEDEEEVEQMTIIRIPDWKDMILGKVELKA